MNIYRLLFIVLFIPALVNAQWVLEQSDDGHWISCQNGQQHQFVVSQSKNEIQFILILDLPTGNLAIPDSALFGIDNNPLINYPLRVLKQRPSSVALQLVLNDTEKDRFIGELVDGLVLHIGFHQYALGIDFPLKGFTNSFSNLLIANDIGLLDPAWLQNRGMNQEMACYEISELSVQSLTARQQGHPASETLIILTEKSTANVEEAVPDIINWAYGIPDAKFPKVPTTKKYGIFKECMLQAQQ